MPCYGWYSRKSAAKDGTATYTRPNGDKVEASYVVEGPDELSVEPGVPIDGLVFLGEVVKLVRTATEDLRPEDFVDPGDFE